MANLETVGIVGLGLLGSAMAERLLAGRFRLIGYDVNPDRRSEFAELGAEPADSASAVFSNCKQVLLSLPTSSHVRQLLAADRHLLKAGTLVIDTTTGLPDEMAELGDSLARRGIGYVDATVAGSSRQAREREVIVMAGGDEADFARARPLLETFARAVHAVGPRGAGARMKLVFNLVLGLSRAVLAEGLEYAASLGVDRRQALEILQDSPAASRVMETKGEKMLMGDFTPEARLAQHLKDVRLILSTGAAAGATLPLSQWHATALQSLVDRGMGELDNSAVIRAFQPRS